MKISLENALGVHPAALTLRAERTQVLARNMAHADTPGFKARDLDFADVLARRTETARTQLVRTRPEHFGAPAGAGSRELKYRTPGMPSADGNTVDMQAEQARFAENNVRFLASLRFLNGKLTGFQNAFRRE